MFTSSFRNYLPPLARSFQSAIIMVVGVVLSGGCQRQEGGVVPVAGVVTLDGMPVDAAYVTFLPANGRPSTGRTDAEGRYDLAYTGKVKGALLGVHRVAVSTKQSPDPDTNSKGSPERIPEWYNTNSTLEVEVTRDQKRYDLRLLTTPPSVEKGKKRGRNSFYESRKSVQAFFQTA